MDKATLVRMDVEAGAEIITALDNTSLRVNVGLWAALADYADPRLVLASRFFDDEDPRDAYGAVFKALRHSKPSSHSVSDILILRMKDPFIRDLRRLFSKTSDVSGMRLGGRSFGGRFLEDAYVYRIK